MYHLQYTGDQVTGEKVTSLFKDIGITYYRERHVYTINVGPAILKTITEGLTTPITITTQDDVTYELLFAEIDYTPPMWTLTHVWRQRTGVLQVHF